MILNGKPWSILEGDCLSVLSTLPAQTFHAVCCSPPYFALRDYKVKGQLGLEKSPAEYIVNMVAVFEEVRRVLRDDGVCWVNLGDSYLGAGGPGNLNGKQGTNTGTHTPPENKKRAHKLSSLAGIPWRFAFALQDAGWHLRSAVVWRKPAPMPESVSGWKWMRCRVKLKSQAAPKQPSSLASISKGATRDKGSNGEWIGGPEFADCPGCPKCSATDGLVLRKGSWRATRSHEFIFMFTKTASYYADGEAVSGGGANLRDVWTIGAEPLSIEHFAAYPTALPTQCLKASTSERGVCAKCGAQLARGSGTEARAASSNGTYQRGKTIGWRATCRCNADAIPAMILDPFAGVGSTIVAARRLGLRAVGIELSPKYCQLARERIEEDNPLFNR